MWVLVRGGLGNQMFQVAFATALAERFCVEPKYIDLSDNARVARSWSLSCFGIEPQPIGMLNKARLGATIVLSRKLRFLGFDDLTGAVIESKDFSGPPNLNKPPRLVGGYWQGPAYFAEHDAAVRARLRFPDIPTSWKLLQPSHECPQVAIHVRRGDYVSDPVARALHLVCDVAWYQGAWQRLRDEVCNCRALVFSDDPEWAREHLALTGDVQYVAGDPNQPAWIDLARMRECQHFVISNSSYSWWAAYLSTSPGKKVIAPRYWFRGVETEMLGICPSSWILL